VAQSTSFRARLEKRASAAKGASEDLWRYREAASVLAYFDYEKLQPLGEVSPDSDARTELLADCEVELSAEGASRWTLRTSIRQAALQRILDGERLDAALAVNPERPATQAQELLETFLKNRDRKSARGIRIRPRFGSPEENATLYQVVSWLTGLPQLEEALPPLKEIRERIARDQLLEPFRALVDNHFAGRRNELEQLSDYVGLYDASSASEGLFRAVERIFSIQERPPLFINGPGGCGKSTLICKFILDHTTIEESSRFPFAYLDFDRVGLLPEEPITLLFEIMRQLAIQFPAASEQYVSITQNWNERLSRKVTSPDGTTDDNEPVSRPKNLRPEDRTEFVNEFAEFVASLKAEEQPLLLVLDTFEEIQFRSIAFADEILDFVNELQKRVPRQRTILAGRADIQSRRYKVRKVVIGDFDKDAAISYLGARGLTDTSVAQRIYEQVGGSPLVLRLAADVAKLEKVDKSGIARLDSGWFSLFQKQSIEAVLYKRILGHVYNKRIEDIAYPGLVLRVITPAVVQEVLGPACEVAIESLDDARELVRLMKARLSTILIPAPGQDEVLIHRPDMRSILLSDLKTKAEKDKKIARKLTNIHTGAINYYSQFSDAARRAEEIYHRLALGIDRPVLASRWMDGLGAFLPSSSIRELPQASQIYLAARLELELPQESWNSAADEDWILYAARLTDDLLALQKPFDALKVLERKTHLLAEGPLRPVVIKVADAAFRDYARQYEQLRTTNPPGPRRTGLMNSLVSRISSTVHLVSPDPSCANKLFQEGNIPGPLSTEGSHAGEINQGNAGLRLVAIAIAEADSNPGHMDMAIAAIKNAISPFEQFHALQVARNLVEDSTAEQRRALRDALEFPVGTPIHDSDPSRRLMKDELLKLLLEIPDEAGSAK
jgi:cellulose synthase operon protein C